MSDQELCGNVFQTVIFIAGHYMCPNPQMVLLLNVSIPQHFNRKMLLLIYLDKFNISENISPIQTTILPILQSSLLAKAILIKDSKEKTEIHKLITKNKFSNLALYSNHKLQIESFVDNDHNVRSFLQKNTPIKNFHGFPLVIRDSIQLYTSVDCCWEVCQFLRNFATIYNATIIFVTQRSENVTFEIDNFSFEDQSYTNHKYFEYVSSNLMEPSKLNTNKYAYYFLPFTTGVWIFHIFAIFCMAFFANMSIKISHQPSEFSLRLLNIFQLSILQGFRRQINHKWHTYLIYVIGTFYGTMMGWFYCISLGSIFITNADDSKYPIICESELLDEFLNSYPDGIKNLELIKVSPEKYWSQMFKLDTNYGFCIENLDWKRLDKFQKVMKSKIFRKVYPDTQGIIPRSLSIRNNSIFMESINEFKTVEFTYGFDQKWRDDFGRSLFLSHIFKVIDYTYSFSSINIDDFKLPILVFLFGAALSVFVFVGELHSKAKARK